MPGNLCNDPSFTGTTVRFVAGGTTPPTVAKDTTTGFNDLHSQRIDFPIVTGGFNNCNTSLSVAWSSGAGIWCNPGEIIKIVFRAKGSRVPTGTESIAVIWTGYAGMNSIVLNSGNLSTAWQTYSFSSLAHPNPGGIQSLYFFVNGTTTATISLYVDDIEIYSDKHNQEAEVEPLAKLEF